jgi:penicillin amidase
MCNPHFFSIIVILLSARILGVFSCQYCLADNFQTFENSELKISRDDKGVWFITGNDDETLYHVFKAMGYAVAVDRLWQAELYRRQARGRLAEIFGKSQLATDIFARSIAYSQVQLEDGFAALSEEARQVIMGYADGFNLRIREIRADPSQLPFEFSTIGQQLGRTFIPANWTYKDILACAALLQRMFDPEALQSGQIDNIALYQRLLNQFGRDGPAMFEDLRWINDSTAPTVIKAEETQTAGSNQLQRQTKIVKNLKQPETAPLKHNFFAAAAAVKTHRNTFIDNLKDINAFVKMGSYAWVVSKKHTTTGNPIIYAGPQMGFEVPSIVAEGSINAGGLNISGMTIPGLPAIIIGRTPHHAWSMQVGHDHTVDFYVEDADTLFLDRVETIKVAKEDDVILPIYGSAHGPIVNPMPYDPAAYDPKTHGPILSWKYSHLGYEFKSIEGLLQLAKSTSMDEFAAGIEKVAVSQHFCYADVNGNIAYWMSGRNPTRPKGEWRLPQGSIALEPVLEWDADLLMKRSTHRNAVWGYYAGWNNKTHPEYDNAYNNLDNIYGPFHRTHVIYAYFDEMIDQGKLFCFEDIRDLALNIAATDSLSLGGNPWCFVKDHFIAAVTRDGISRQRQTALSILTDWDGHFVKGGEALWPHSPDRADGWILMDAWIQAVLQLTFADEGLDDQPDSILFNVLLRGLSKDYSSPLNQYDWFTNVKDSGAPNSADEIIVFALDRVLERLDLNQRPWGKNKRGEIIFTHGMLGDIHSLPFANRSTYAQCIEYGHRGPIRIESMFPLGQSGDIRIDAKGNPVFNQNYFSMAKNHTSTPILYDLFEMRTFPLFD